MRLSTWKALAVGAVLVMAAMQGAAYGQVTFSLSSPDDLNQLIVGNTATFEVRLSGIAAGQELDAAAAIVGYDSALLGPPGIVPGPIVPDPLLDPLDFVAAPAAGIADATFLTFGENSSDHILADGVLFRFEVEVLAAGSGSLSFDFVDATRFNAQNPFSPIPLTASGGPPLDFVSVVPEPAALWLALAAAMLVGFGRRFGVGGGR